MPFEAISDDYYHYCPYCKEQYADTWELFLSSTWPCVTECSKCGKKFTVEAEQSVTYISREVAPGDL